MSPIIRHFYKRSRNGLLLLLPTGISPTCWIPGLGAAACASPEGGGRGGGGELDLYLLLGASLARGVGTPDCGLGPLWGCRQSAGIWGYRQELLARQAGRWLFG